VLKVNHLQRYSEFYHLLLFGFFPLSRLFRFLEEGFIHLKKETHVTATLWCVI